MNGPRLTEDEQENTMKALHFLRTRVGTWALLAKALGLERCTLRNAKTGTNRIFVNMAYRAARLAGVPFDDAVTGKYPVKGMCPHCRHAASDA